MRVCDDLLVFAINRDYGKTPTIDPSFGTILYAIEEKDTPVVNNKGIDSPNIFDVTHYKSISERFLMNAY